MKNVGEMQKLNINLTKISFVDCGRGSPVVFVHGFPLDQSMWNGQIEAFSADHRVIAPDLRGFGQSDPGGDVTGMAQFADDIAALLDELKIGEPVVLCGLSMGGYIAFEFWNRYADRLRGLIFCDTRAANDSLQVGNARRAVAERVLCEGAEFLAQGMIANLFDPTTGQDQPELIEAIRTVIRGTKPRGIAAAARGMALRSDFTETLPKIACPTLVIVGENDVISPATVMQEMANAIPKAQLAVIPKAGHMSPLEQPAVVNAAIDEFFKSL